MVDGLYLQFVRRLRDIEKHVHSWKKASNCFLYITPPSILHTYIHTANQGIYLHTYLTHTQLQSTTSYSTSHKRICTHPSITQTSSGLNSVPTSNTTLCGYTSTPIHTCPLPSSQSLSLFISLQTRASHPLIKDQDQFQYSS
jgi:hypothetical protein